MKTPHFKPIPNAIYFTSFCHEHGIDVLVRSADWYKVSPIQRYLLNMAASSIRMEDTKTETRTYTYAKFEHLIQLLDRAAGQECEVAWEAWMLWSDSPVHFGVVHLDQADGRRGDILLGDSMRDYLKFAPAGDGEKRWTHLVTPAHGPKGSDV